MHEVASRLAAEPRGVIVCGPSSEQVAEPAGRLAAETGWPLLAEPTSGVRCGDHDRSHVVAHYDLLLRIEDSERPRAWPGASRRRHAHVKAASRIRRGVVTDRH